MKRFTQVGTLALAAALVAAVIFMATGSTGKAGGASALQVQFVGHQRLAQAGNTQAASLVVAVNNEFGPYYGLGIDNFQVNTPLVPAGGCLISVTGVTPDSTVSGVYTLDVVPFTGNPNCAWLRGEYAVSINATTPDYAYTGSAVGKLVIQ